MAANINGNETRLFRRTSFKPLFFFNSFEFCIILIPGYLIICVVISSLSLAIRALRWRELLASLNPPSFKVMFGVTNIGYLGNTLLPARAGELIRSYLLGRKSRTSASFVLATAIVERAVDALILIFLAIGLTLVMFGLPGWLLNSIIITGLVGITLLVVFATMHQLEPLFQKTIRKIPLPMGYQEKIIGMVSQFIFGCQALKNPVIMTRFFLFSILIWLTDAASTSIMAYSFGFNLNIGQSLLYLSALGLSSAIPSTPGYVGVYQFVAVNLLPYFGWTPSQALSFVIFAQFMTLLVILFWGMVSLIGFNINPRQLLKEATSESKAAGG